MTKNQSPPRAGNRYGMSQPSQIVPQAGAGGQTVGDGDPYAATPAPVGPSRPTYDQSVRINTRKEPREGNTHPLRTVNPDPKSKHKFD